MKSCPFCAEEIQDAAVVCKHCGRSLTPTASPIANAAKAKKKNTGWFPKFLLVLAVLWVASLVINYMDKTPKMLTSEQRATIGRVFSEHKWAPPDDVQLRDGIVVVDLLIPNGIGARTIGESRLLALREALLPSGFTSYRVNVNGPKPSPDMTLRYGSSRFLDGGRVEWLTP